jgi:WhiB family transcriptional regulator, redox-sensing transcriptional regulator
MAAPGHHATLHGPGLPPFTGDTRMRCHLGNADEFFSPEEERGHQRVARETRARAICRRCPLVDDCLEWSIDEQVPHGTWGGMTEKERAAEIARRDQLATKWAA